MPSAVGNRWYEDVQRSTLKDMPRTVGGKTSREIAHRLPCLPPTLNSPTCRTGRRATVLRRRLPRVAVRGSGRETAGGSAERGPSWFGSRHSGAGFR
jgi:hypothetical protein